MTGLKIFFQNFFNRSGLAVLSATIVARLLSFFASWIALQLILEPKLGLAIYAINIISLIIPISGFGAFQGLLRYGSLLEIDNDKYNLFFYVIKKGSLFSLILIILTLILSPLLTRKLPGALPYLMGMSVTIFTLFLLESLKIHFRILQNNQLFAKVEISYNLLLVFFVALGSFLWGSSGYILSLVLTPLITFLIFFPKNKMQRNSFRKLKRPEKGFWHYSFFASLSNLTAQLLIVLDIILIGNILHDPGKVTLYKYISLIPFSVLFLPRAMMTTDFVALTQKHNDQIFIRHYIKNYTLIFGTISIFLLGFSAFFAENILRFFGEEFIQYQTTFLVLVLGITSILLFRGLYGNLLSTLGKAAVNYRIALAGIVINIIFNYLLIPQYGILGAAITSAAVMWFTSLITTVIYFYYFKKISTQK